MKKRIIFYGLLALAAYIYLPTLAGSRRAKIPLAETDIKNLSAAFNQYNLEFGVYPVGSNADVLKVLLGANSKKIKFFDTNPGSINSKEEFVDPWKTPYEIKMSEETNYLIRSAGPNKIFGDKDDLTNSAPPNAVPPASTNSVTNPFGKIGAPH